MVNVGDTIARDQPILELETDKATIEVPSSVAGVVKEIKVKKGDKIQVGAVVLTVDEAAGNGAASGQTAGAANASTAAADQAAAPQAEQPAAAKPAPEKPVREESVPEPVAAEAAPAPRAASEERKVISMPSRAAV